MSGAADEQASTSDISVRLFGTMEAFCSDVAVDFRTRKEKWLLSLLCLRGGLAVDRGWLSGVLWPDSERDAARYYLRRSLSDLNRRLGSARQRIQVDGNNSIRIDLTGAFCDLDAFDTAIARGDLASLRYAIDLYRGPLLQDCAEEWVQPERIRREHDYRQAIETLATVALANSDWISACGYARRLIAGDPFHESAYRILMQALGHSGNAAEATQVYRDLRILLREELSSEPDPETQSLFQSMKRAAPPAAKSVSQIKPDVNRASLPAQDKLELSSLPHPISNIIGRDELCFDIAQTLREARLVSLVGPGGIGKTRVAIEVAKSISSHYIDGAKFIDLASTTGREQLLIAFVRALNMRDDQSVPLEAAIIEAIRDKRMLLVADNCEHLRTECAKLFQSILSNCNHVVLLVTSRQALRLTGETVLLIPALECPPDLTANITVSKNRHNLQEYLEYSAVTLFVTRARESNPAFKPTLSNLPSIASICRHLDGLALAIELAAARTRILSVDQILIRLNDRFRLLSNGNPASLPRQQTLLALIDWSYALLDLEERRLFAYLSLFVGGCSIEAVEAIIGSVSDRSDDPDAVNLPSKDFWTAVELLDSLVDRSMIVAEEHNGVVRYRMLATIREYAQRCFKLLPEAAEISCRFCRYFEALLWSTWDSPVEQGVAAVSLEYTNILAAVDLSLIDPEGSRLALSLVCGLERIWHVKSYFGQAERYLNAACSRLESDSTSELMVRAKLCHANIARLVNRFDEAIALYQHCLEIIEAVGPSKLLVRALSGLTYVYVLMGNLEQAKLITDRALEISRKNENQHEETGALVKSVYVLRSLKEYDQAYEQCIEAIRLAVLTNQQRLEYEAYHELGHLHLARDEFEAARSCFEKNFRHYQAIGSQGGISEALHDLAEVSRASGDVRAAVELIQQSLSLSMEIQYRVGILGCLQAAARLFAECDRFEEAAVLIGWCEADRSAHRLAQEPTDLASVHTQLEQVLGTDRYTALISRGAALSLDEAVQRAMNE